MPIYRAGRNTLKPSAMWMLASGAALALFAGADLWSAEPAAQPAPAAKPIPAAKLTPALKFSIGGPTLSGASQPAAVEAPGATHQQVRVIHPAEGENGLSLASFCLTKDGRIVAALSRASAGGGGAILSIHLGASAGGSTPEKSAEKPSPGEVRLLDADGKLLKKWPLDFTPQAVNVGPDDCVYVGGDGTLARYDLEGKELARGDSPQIAAAKQNPKELERQARESLEQQQHMFDQLIKQLETRRDQLKAKQESDLKDDERQQLKQLDQMIETYKKMAANQHPQPITDAQVKALASQMAAQDKRINAVAAGAKYVYITTRESKGYGYCVWRTDLDFKNAKSVVGGLAGCCGQTDVECCGDEFVVAENSRYRVTRYDAEGKKLASFGKSQRDGVGEGFSGCCNPMNTRPVGDKLYVAESNGVVKLFSRDGKYEGVVGAARVQAGCKSSIVDATADGQRVYYFDVRGSGICVLERGPAKDAEAH